MQEVLSNNFLELLVLYVPLNKLRIRFLMKNKSNKALTQGGNADN